MIKSALIQNFQSHKKSFFDFHPGLNVILGDTDSGKSALLRALRWGIWNKPIGEDFRSHWGSDTKVVLELEDGNLITRIKKPENIYKLNKQTFKAFKTEVPIEIREALNIEDINFQRQIDNHFLLRETDGKVAAFFNKIAKLDKIDSSTQIIKGKIRNTNQTIAHKEKDIEVKKKELEKYNTLDSEIALFEEIEKDVGTSEKLKEDRNKIVFILEQLDAVKSKLAKLTYLLKLEDIVNSTLALIEKRNKLNLERVQLNLILKAIQEKEEKLIELRKLSKLKNLVNQILNDIADRNKVNAEISDLNNIIEESNSIKLKLAEIKGYKVILKKKFDKHMKVCPLCNTKLK